MTGVEVVARRWARGWELHVTNVGVTQSKSLARARQDVADYVELMTGHVPSEVSFRYQLGAMDRRIGRLRTARRQAAAAQQTAADLARELVADLRELGLSGDDIARVMEVSPQRVSQLTSQRRKTVTTLAGRARRSVSGHSGPAAKKS